MIKRRFYKQDHADKNDGSDDSSSSSDSDSIEEEEEEEVEVEEEEEKLLSQSPGSGYQSEDSSGNEVGYDSSDDESDRHDKKKRKDIQSTGKCHLETEEGNSFDTKDSTQSELEDCILKCKSVFKCRLCPRIVCLTEDTLRLHLKSKTRSFEKLLNEGRLKLMLNSDGEIDEDQETHAERHARTIALARDAANQQKKNKGRQRQRQRLRRKKVGGGSIGWREKKLMKNPAKRRRKNED